MTVRLIDNPRGSFGLPVVLPTDDSGGGGTASGVFEALHVQAVSGSAYTVDLNLGTVHDVKLTANCALTFPSNLAIDKSYSCTIILRQDATGGRTVSWPASVVWQGGTPTLTATPNRVDIFVFVTVDGGGRWGSKMVMNNLNMPFTPSAPAAPQNLFGGSLNLSAQLDWDNNTETNLAYYKVYQNGVALPQQPIVSDMLVTGLTNGVAYSFQVSAVNTSGVEGPKSNTAVVTPSASGDTTPPDPPTSLVATPLDRQVKLDWLGGGEFDFLKFQYTVNDGITTTGPFDVTVPAHTKTVPGLVNGTSYTFGVRALDNNLNASAYTTVVSTPSDMVLPTVPSGLNALPGNGQVHLTWTANDPVTDPDLLKYQYRVGTTNPPAGAWSEITDPLVPDMIVTSLSNGTLYYFQVRAVDDDANASGASAVVSATPAAQALVDQISASSGAGGTASSLPVTLPLGAPAVGELLVCAVGVSGTQTVINAPTISGSGRAFTQKQGVSDGSGRGLRVFELIAASGDGATVTATLTSAKKMDVILLRLTGNTASPYDSPGAGGAQFGTGTSATLTGAGNTTQALNVIIAWVWTSAAHNGVSWPGPWTEVPGVETIRMSAAYQVVATVATYSVVASWVNSTDGSYLIEPWKRV